MQDKIETRVGFFVLVALAIFMYMGFKIGAFRFDRAQYDQYILYFNDISGLSRKAAVKIAGVKVGWVEKLQLIPNHTMKAEVIVMIKQDYPLYENAYAIVRQDGLLGPKFVDIIPGDPLLRKLEPGEPFKKASVDAVNLDELMHQFKDIASNVLDVSESFKDAFAGPEGSSRIKSLVGNLENAAKQFSTLTDVVERSFIRNEEHIDSFLEIGTNFRSLTEKLETNVFPAFQDSIVKISNVFDRDFGRIATHVESTTEALEAAALQARDGLRSVSSVAEKIDEGKGLLGKLVNEDETYRDIRVAIGGFKNYVTKLDRMQIIFDSHSENMHRRAENYRYVDFKGYLDVRIHPNEEHFYQLTMASSEKGFIHRRETERTYVTPEGQYPVDITQQYVPQSPVDKPPTLLSNNNFENILPSDEKLETVFRKKKLIFDRNTLKVGMQFGKIFGDIAIRLGMFEGSAGVGIDVDIPFKTDKLRWLTTGELFDFRGWNRKNDKRMHLKWLNKMYLMRNIYFVFGADDIISKRNASVFFGVGVRFGDDDVKYMLTNISGASGLAGT